MRFAKTILFGLSLFLIPITFLFAGKMELTTYYPAPNGEYGKLQSSGSCVGTTCGTLPTDVTNDQLKVKGDVQVDGKIRVGGSTNSALVIQKVTTPPASPEDGQMWIR